jgi:hypothetical protein
VYAGRAATKITTTLQIYHVALQSQLLCRLKGSKGALEYKERNSLAPNSFVIQITFFALNLR